MTNVDVLMIAHKRADYLAQTLPRLLESLPDGARAWIWQNDSYPDTTAVIEEHRRHPRFYRYHHSETNQRLAVPTNWLWTNAVGSLVGKVDDDCLVPDGWIEAFVAAHERPSLGIIAAWHFLSEDLRSATLETRTIGFGDGRLLIRNCWVGGSGYLMKRTCISQHGFLSERRSFTEFCLDLSLAGWEIGWHYPLVLQDHLDDPRSPNTGIKSTEELLSRGPLGSRKLREPTVEAWDAQLREGARHVQTASLRPADHIGWRRRIRRLITSGTPGRR